MSYIDHLGGICRKDVETLESKDKEYGGSWLKRGGVGAFMMLARKWDRLEQAMEREVSTIYMSSGETIKPKDKYDILERALIDGREEGILDDIGDLRRYLLLVESEVRERMKVKPGEKPSINTHKRLEGILPADDTDLPTMRDIGW
jgi:hypothetical protein